ncbi:zinc finger BED domain-containing protein RICESLEEPER 2-like [Carya illinoinensis]|uniref:zinc finger BED domain-containing protein RICESLEEPER 2-like n=1 Tax=Carya illinoinensis TaxID=32201 RepID=UPI001C724B96|nr:zinc finger BED domain-containing protein RICESLEEPER 2-like [Carya illinoinensis]
MGDPVNDVDPVEEYENENSVGISLVEAISDNDRDTAQNSQAPNIVSTEGPSTEVQTVAYERKKRKRTSDVWKDFVEVDSNGVKQPQCKWCKTIFKASRSSSTTTLCRHLLTCLPYMGSKKKQKVLAVESKEADGAFTVSNFTYDRNRVRELASHMILYHEYPFSLMKHVVFNRFMSANTPYWEKMSRAAAKKECMRTNENEKTKLRALLKHVNKVHITTDMWTSCQKLSYMVVTCHFIDSDWHLQRRVLNFCNVPPPHTGLLIADALEKCFQSLGIENKISSITVDNASSNDVAILILKDDFRLKKTLSYGLGEIRDIVDCVRDGIKYLVASESRLKQFSEIAKQLQLPSKKLILDVPTRWNSTYLMLDVAIQFKEVFPRYGDRDRCFEWIPTVEEWGQVENVCQLLAIFNEVTNIVSGSDYPTANLFLSEVWRMKDILGKKSRDENEYMKSMVRKMSAKFDKYWGDCNLLMSIAVVLDPRFKMVLIQFCFPLIYHGPEAVKNIDHVSAVLLELYNEYVHEYNSTLKAQREQDNARMNVSGSSSSVGTGRSMQSGQSLFKSFVRSVDTVQLSKSELDNYLKESIYICEEGSDASFDALEWWKTNSLKFRTLSKLARDILATPITTVSSESTFSAGGRVIDPHRASLKIETVQMLLCGSDWVRALYGLKRSSTNSMDVPSETHILLPQQ